MKMSAEALAELRSAIEPLDTDYRRDQYRQRAIPNGERVGDIDKRYRWDLMYMATPPSWALRQYDDFGLDDRHIDTALRSIVPPL